MQYVEYFSIERCLLWKNIPHIAFKAKEIQSKKKHILHASKNHKIASLG
jgi:hypothetical protein